MIPPSLGQAMARIETIEGLLDRLSEATPSNQSANGTSFEAMLSAQLNGSTGATGSAAAAAMQSAAAQGTALGLGGQNGMAQSALSKALSGLATTSASATGGDLDLTPVPANIKQLALAAAQRYGVDPALVLSVINTESDFNPNCTSSAGAMGLMQLMPENCTEYAVSNPYDAAENIDGGVRQLRDMLTKYNGDARLALAAYNAGPTAVKRYDGIPPYKETQNYVRKVLGSLAYYHGQVTGQTVAPMADATLGSSATLAGLVGTGLNATGATPGVSPQRRIAAARPEGQPAAGSPVPATPMVPLTPMVQTTPLPTTVAPVTTQTPAGSATAPLGLGGLTTRAATAPQPLATESVSLPPSASQVQRAATPAPVQPELTPLAEPTPGSAAAPMAQMTPMAPAMAMPAPPLASETNGSNLPAPSAAAASVITPTASAGGGQTASTSDAFATAVTAPAMVPLASDAAQSPAWSSGSGQPAVRFVADAGSATATAATTAGATADAAATATANVPAPTRLLDTAADQPIMTMDLEVVGAAQPQALGQPQAQPATVADDMARWLAGGAQPTATPAPTVAPAEPSPSQAQPIPVSQPQPQPQPVSMASVTVDTAVPGVPTAPPASELSPSADRPVEEALDASQPARQAAPPRHVEVGQAASSTAGTSATTVQPTPSRTSTATATAVPSDPAPAPESMTAHVAETFGARASASGAMPTGELVGRVARHLAPTATTPAGQSAEATLAQIAQTVSGVVREVQTLPTDEQPAEAEDAQASARTEQASRPRALAPDVLAERQRPSAAAEQALATNAPVTAAVAAAQPGSTGGQSSHSGQRQVSAEPTRAVSATDGTNVPTFSLAEASRTAAPAQVTQGGTEVAARDLSDMTAQLAGRAKLVRTPGHDEFTVRLELPEVGQVAVRIVRDGGGVSVNLQTGSDSLRRALQDQMPHLESALREQGVQMSSFSAGDRGDQRQDAYQAWFGQQAGQGQQQRRGEAMYQPGTNAGVNVEPTVDAVGPAQSVGGQPVRDDLGSDRGFSRWA
ncbi:MAG: transglycosylase SLT domain-containing protein [Armatimonadetes bacterium]|nr:transglycosylase SLT domain-containing protein [Armatimonadota bacterium]